MKITAGIIILMLSFAAVSCRDTVVIQNEFRVEGCEVEHAALQPDGSLLVSVRAEKVPSPGKGLRFQESIHCGQKAAAALFLDMLKKNTAGRGDPSAAITLPPAHRVLLKGGMAERASQGDGGWTVLYRQPVAGIADISVPGSPRRATLPSNVSALYRTGPSGDSGGAGVAAEYWAGGDTLVILTWGEPKAGLTSEVQRMGTALEAAMLFAQMRALSIVKGAVLENGVVRWDGTVRGQVTKKAFNPDGECAIEFTVKSEGLRASIPMEDAIASYSPAGDAAKSAAEKIPPGEQDAGKAGAGKTGVNEKGLFGIAPLHLAAKEPGMKAVASIQDLVRRGAEVNIADDAGFTPLHYAVRERNLAAVKLLVGKGGDISRANNEGDTPLHLTSDTAAAKFLGDRGADVNAKNSLGDTPLHNAARYGPVATVRYLVSKGARADLRNNAGDSPVTCAFQKGNDEPAEFLLGRIADASGPDSQGITLLHHAAVRGNVALAGKLLAKGADVNARSAGSYASQWRGVMSPGLTPLDFAVLNDRDAMVRYLDMKKGRPGNAAVNGQGWTLLHYAAMSRKADIIRMLLGYGIDKNLKTTGEAAGISAGKTARDIAEELRYSEIAELLK